MKYKINVSKAYGPNWNNTGMAYEFYFRVYGECVDRSKRIIGELKGIYPSPEYKICLTETKTYMQDVDIDYLDKD
jgi:hypothetical protein